MKKIINGKVYNTQTAECLVEWDNGHFTSDFHYCSEDLYRKRTGEYFLHGQGGAMSKYSSRSGNSSGWGDQIIPLTLDEAKEWAEKKLDGDEFEPLFGEIQEDDTKTRVNWYLDGDLVDDLRKRTADTGVTISYMVSNALRAAGYGKK